MKSFDAFARPVQEFQVKTAIGGYISIGSICLVAVLFFSELSYFLTLDTKDEMLIDQSQERKYLNASLDISFSALPCSVLSINLMDPKQNNVMHVAHEIYKTRLSSTGEVIGKPIRNGLENVAMTPADLATVFRDIPTRANHSSAISRCPSCFQSLFDEDSCCNSCKEVRDAFLNRGWDDRPDDYVFAQCIEEAYQRTAAEANEGCRLKARLHVRKVPAMLHIGVSQRIRRDLVRASSLADVTVSADFSHHIHNLSFGPDFPGLVRVLDGRQKSSHQKPTSEHYQYDVHVIPTRYQEDGSDENFDCRKNSNSGNTSYNTNNNNDSTHGNKSNNNGNKIKRMDPTKSLVTSTVSRNTSRLWMPETLVTKSVPQVLGLGSRDYAGLNRDN